MIGVTCHDSRHLAMEAAEAGADYVAFGSFFPSSVKPHAVRATIGLLQEARKCFATPIVVIGGITLENAETLIEAGADAVAVISDLFDAPDVRDRATAFGRLFKGRLIESRGRDEGSARG
jgi:thiamine-phosphate pyrophosphorylase